jgi:hypothetical protein
MSQPSDEQEVMNDLRRQPFLFKRLAENALLVAESLRDNYFKNTASFVGTLRKIMRATEEGRRKDPILTVYKADKLTWANVQGEVVTFIDGGVGQVQISSQVPVLLRVGSYCVKTGEWNISQREQFGYYPVILGDLEGGSKERKDYVDIVRITAELLGGISALERTPDLRVLMFHGPLVYTVGAYAGHTPFTEHDIDLFLHQYGTEAYIGRDIKQEFSQASVYVYPSMSDRPDEYAKRHLFEPLAWMAYLYSRLIKKAQRRDPIPLIAGVVERGGLREFVETILLARVFQGLHARQDVDYFNRIFGRSDLKTPKSFLDKLGYDDELLLAMLLQRGEYSESWNMRRKYAGITGNRNVQVVLPGESFATPHRFDVLLPDEGGTGFAFPQVDGCYVRVSEMTDPIRVEVFPALGQNQIAEIAQRVYLYSQLLPGYGFPVGLDIADKYAHIPNWMTEAYGKIIRNYLGVSLQSGEISDAEMRRILVQAIYITHRDWLFRPKSS